MSWNYSDMSHEAAQHGGPEQYIQDIKECSYTDGYDNGYDEGYEEGYGEGTGIGLLVGGIVAFIAIIAPHVNEWFKNRAKKKMKDVDGKSILREKAEIAEAEVIKGMKNAEIIENETDDQNTQNKESAE